MKKITLALAVLLVSTCVFAHGPIKSPLGTSSVVVTSKNGSSVFRLYYKALAPGNVNVVIRNAEGDKIFTETITKSSGFARPYNLSGLAEGEYTIEVDDGFGKMIEKVTHGMEKTTKLVKVTKVKGDEGKYLLTVSSKKADNIAVKIFDDHGDLLLNQSYTVNGEFAQLFNLKEISSFTIQIEDSEGVIKTTSY